MTVVERWDAWRSRCSGRNQGQAGTIPGVYPTGRWPPNPRQYHQPRIRHDPGWPRPRPQRPSQAPRAPTRAIAPAHRLRQAHATRCWCRDGDGSLRRQKRARQENSTESCPSLEPNDRRIRSDQIADMQMHVADRRRGRGTLPGHRDLPQRSGWRHRANGLQGDLAYTHVLQLSQRRSAYTSMPIPSGSAR